MDNYYLMVIKSILKEEKVLNRIILRFEVVSIF